MSDTSPELTAERVAPTKRITLQRQVIATLPAEELARRLLALADPKDGTSRRDRRMLLEEAAERILRHNDGTRRHD